MNARGLAEIRCKGFTWGGWGPIAVDTRPTKSDGAMDLKEFAGYAAGTAFLLAVAGVALGGLVLVLGSVPILLLIFPLTIGAVGVVFLVGYLRHRARRRRARGG